jgi:hypothetical protein
LLGGRNAACHSPSLARNRAAEGKVTLGTATRSADGDTIELAPDMADRLRKLFRVWIQEGR